MLGRIETKRMIKLIPILIIVFVLWLTFSIGKLVGIKIGKKKQFESDSKVVPSPELVNTLVAVSELVNPNLEKELLGIQKELNRKS